MELKIEKLQELQPIGFNYKQLKKELSDNLKKYEGLTFIDDKISEAKTDRASLNKLKKAINDEKILIKKKFIVPYVAFEDKIKELMGMIEKPIDEIDSQVKAFEEKTRKEKKDKIFELFEEINSDIVKMEMVYDETWLNSSVGIKRVTEEIEKKVESIENDVKAIRSFKSDFEVQLEDLYFKTLNLGQVFIEKTRLDELKKAKDEEKKEPEPEKPPVIKAERIVMNDVETVDEMDFRVWATKTQLDDLKTFLVENKIRYGKVPKGE